MSLRLRAQTLRRLRRPLVAAAARSYGGLAARGGPSATRTRTAAARIPMTPMARLARSFSDFTEVVPSLGDSISDAVVVQWVKGPGDYVQEQEVYVILETDKVTVDVRATKGGLIKSVAAEEGDTIDVGQDILVMDTAAEAPAGGAAAAAAPAEAAATAPAAPAALAAPAAAPAPAAAAPAADASPGARSEYNVPLSRMRLTIANRLKETQNTAALLTTFNEIDMTNIMALRSKYKDDFTKAHDVKLGFMSIFVKASTHALIKTPAVNGMFDKENKCITYRDYVDISVAVGTPTGLVVPVLRNTENMSFAGVESAIGALGKKAKEGKIAMEDMVGGNFTISNGGVYGSLMGTPIINGSQSAILGMHGIFKRPVVIGDKVEIRPMMYVALTYDHRIVDGGQAVGFLKDIKNAVEDPVRLLLEL